MPEVSVPTPHHESNLTHSISWEGHWQRHYERAKHCVDAGQYQLAVALLRRVIRQKEEHAEAWYLLGYAFSELKRHKQAVECFDRVVELAPEWAEGWANRGWSRLCLKNLRGAIDDINSAVEIQPSLAEAHANLALAYKRANQLDKATDSFKNATLADPENEIYAYRLGRCLVKQADSAGATIWFRRSLEINPGYWPAWIELSVRTRRLGDFSAVQTERLQPVPTLTVADSPSMARLLVREEQRAVTRSQPPKGFKSRLRPLLQNPLAWIAAMVLAALIWTLLGN